MGRNTESLHGEILSQVKEFVTQGPNHNFSQIPGESISATWEQFVKYLRSVPGHIISHDSLVQIFYQELDDKSKVVANTIIRGSFLDCTFAEITYKMERVAKTNHVWGIRDS